MHANKPMTECSALTRDCSPTVLTSIFLFTSASSQLQQPITISAVAATHRCLAAKTVGSSPDLLHVGRPLHETAELQPKSRSSAAAYGHGTPEVLSSSMRHVAGRGSSRYMPFWW